MPARRKYVVPKGLKPVRRKLATGEVKLYWYHRATGKRLKNAPDSAQGLLEVARLDEKAASVEAPLARSLARLWDDYRKSPEWLGLKPRTRSDYQAVRDWVGDAAGRILVADIVKGDITVLRDKAFKEKGRRFANYVVQVLRMLLGWATDRPGWREDNPAVKVKAIRKPTGSRVVNRAWSPVEVRAFLSAAPPQLALPFALGLFAGMRQGDALVVTWSAYNGAMLRWIAGKNGEECFAPVSGQFKEWLDAAKAKRGDALQIATTSTGSVWTQSGFRASFFKLVRKLVAEGKLQPGCTFHGLRHTIASGARDDGASNYQVAAAIGDRSTAMAETYGRDADRQGAQIAILEANQKRFANIERKTERKTAPKSGGKP